MARRSRQASSLTPGDGAESVGVTVLPGVPLPDWLVEPTMPMAPSPVPSDAGATPMGAPLGGPIPTGAPAERAAPTPFAPPSDVPVGMGSRSLASAAMTSAPPVAEVVGAAPGGTGSSGPFDWELDSLPWAMPPGTGPASTGAPLSSGGAAWASATPPVGATAGNAPLTSGAASPGSRSGTTTALGSPAGSTTALAQPAGARATLAQPAGAPATLAQPAGAPATLAQPAGATAALTSPARPGGAVPGAGVTGESWGDPARPMPDLAPDQLALVQQLAAILARGDDPATVVSAALSGAAGSDPGAPASVPGVLPGLIPDPSPGAAGARATGDGPPRRRRGPLLAAGAVVLVAGTGAAMALVGIPMLRGDDTQQAAAAPTLRMPSAVGDLVVVTDPQVGDALTPLIGFGLRPHGATVTAGYGPTATGALTLAAMATTMPSPSGPDAQLTSWSTRTRTALGKPVAGQGPTAGVTCAATEAGSPTPGSYCVWTGAGLRGQAFVTDATAEAALTTASELRNALTATSSPAA